jgi:L-cysteine desulfidase
MEVILVINNVLRDILVNQVTPALGCTEPGAVAFCAARAAEILNKPVESLEVVVNKNILKNGMGVGIPGTVERGLDFAAALGIYCGDSKYGLEVLKNVNAECISSSKKAVSEGMINVVLDKTLESLYIKSVAKNGNYTATVIVKDSHTNIVFESLNEQIITDNENSKMEIPPTSTDKNLKFKIKEFSIDQLIDYVSTVPLEELSFIKDGINMNLTLANVGVTEEIGLGIGKHFTKLINDLPSKAKAFTVAASEARMSGYPLPVMSSAGSGNHGLVAIIPISIMGKDLGLSEEKIIRSVALSHLVTIFVKVHLGVLTPVCGCGVAAGLGCAAGITYLNDGTPTQIRNSIDNMVAGVSGMFCDGAKIGCAYKAIPSDNGILGDTTEESIRNLAHVSVHGMNNTDEAILDVMTEKCI